MRLSWIILKLSAEIGGGDRIGAAAGAYSGTDAGVIAVQNNFLSAKDVMDMKKALEEADKSRTDKQVIYQNPIYSTNYY